MSIPESGQGWASKEPNKRNRKKRAIRVAGREVGRQTIKEILL
jgi:hypothetical protein